MQIEHDLQQLRGDLAIALMAMMNAMPLHAVPTQKERDQSIVQVPGDVLQRILFYAGDKLTQDGVI